MARAFEPYGLECEACVFFTRYIRKGDIMGHCGWTGLKTKKFDSVSAECENCAKISFLVKPE